MKLVKRHIITKNHSFWSEIDHLAFLSKNLFNLANYYYRQHFFKHQEQLNFNQLYHTVSKTVEYKALPTKVSKQIIRRLDSAWRSYEDLAEDVLEIITIFSARLYGSRSHKIGN